MTPTRAKDPTPRTVGGLDAAALAACGCAAAIVDADGHLVQVNESFAGLHQATVEELAGRDSAELYPPAVAVRQRDADLAALRSPRPLFAEEPILDQVGRRTVAVWRLAVPDASGKPAAVCRIYATPTAHKRLRADCERLYAQLRPGVPLEADVPTPLADPDSRGGEPAAARATLEQAAAELARERAARDQAEAAAARERSSRERAEAALASERDARAQAEHDLGIANVELEAVAARQREREEALAGRLREALERERSDRARAQEAAQHERAARAQAEAAAATERELREQAHADVEAAREAQAQAEAALAADRGEPNAREAALAADARETAAALERERAARTEAEAALAADVREATAALERESAARAEAEAALSARGQAEREQHERVVAAADAERDRLVAELRTALEQEREQRTRLEASIDAEHDTAVAELRTALEQEREQRARLEASIDAEHDTAVAELRTALEQEREERARAEAAVEAERVSRMQALAAADGERTLRERAAAEAHAAREEAAAALSAERAARHKADAALISENTRRERLEAALATERSKRQQTDIALAAARGDHARAETALAGERETRAQIEGELEELRTAFELAEKQRISSTADDAAKRERAARVAAEQRAAELEGQLRSLGEELERLRGELASAPVPQVESVPASPVEDPPVPLSAPARPSGALARMREVVSRGGQVDGLVPLLLSAIGEELSWDAAVLWRSEREGRQLACQAVWTGGDTGLAAFETLSWQTLVHDVGEGPLAEAWREGAPRWSAELESAGSRAGAAGRAGLQLCVAVPVRSGRRVPGVLELFSREERELDEAALTELESAAGVFASLMRREQSADRLRWRV